MKILHKTIFCCVLSLTFMVLSLSQARAEITITPMRVLFEDRDRFATVTLVNTGQEEETYKIGLRFFTMQETGPAYKASDKSNTDFDLSKYLVMTPKRVTLAAGGKQTIRLALRRPPEIPPGDYVVHLEIASVPAPPAPPAPVGNDSAPKAQAVVSINVGYTLPVILRVGKEDVKATIDQISLRTNPKTNLLIATVPVRREGGPYAVLGYLYVYHKGADGKEVLVGEISNAHIFPEVNKRVFEAYLQKKVEGGSLHVVLKYFDKNNAYTYAEKTFPLN